MMEVVTFVENTIKPFTLAFAPWVALVLAGIAHNNWKATRNNADNGRVAQIYANVMTHNSQIWSNNYRQIAVATFISGMNRDLFPDQRGPDFNPETQEEIYNLYWATRAIHLNHMNLIAQAWALSNSNLSEFEMKFPGWVDFAFHVASDILGKNRASKPNWYNAACADLWPLSNNFIYGADFVKFMEEVGQPTDPISKNSPWPSHIPLVARAK